MGLQTFMEQISASAAPVEFSEGDEKKTQTPLEFMQSFLQALPKAIEFGEVSGGAHAGGATGADAAAKLDTFTRAKMEENKDLSYSQAFAEAQKEYPELAAEYAAELG
jgi:hypothetical protein